jgi:hypothetical protein
VQTPRKRDPLSRFSTRPGNLARLLRALPPPVTIPPLSECFCARSGRFQARAAEPKIIELLEGQRHP